MVLISWLRLLLNQHGAILLHSTPADARIHRISSIFCAIALRVPVFGRFIGTCVDCSQKCGYCLRYETRGFQCARNSNARDDSRASPDHIWTEQSCLDVLSSLGIRKHFVHHTEQRWQSHSHHTTPTPHEKKSSSTSTASKVLLTCTPTPYLIIRSARRRPSTRMTRTGRFLAHSTA